LAVWDVLPEGVREKVMASILIIASGVLCVCMVSWAFDSATSERLEAEHRADDTMHRALEKAKASRQERNQT
jgi:hypothetical protein